MRKPSGFTLIEVILAIVIIGTSLVVAIGAFTRSNASAVNAMIQQQATSVANAYLNEILALPYSDPDGIGGEASRSTFDDVLDYNGFSEVGARTRAGAQMAGLSQLSIAIAVRQVGMGPAPSVPMRQVTVTVADPSGAQVRLVGYRSAQP
ncbi:MAG TPA: type II secretion system protein [Steroidobacteraceae bacterium]|nr:type II secretion system protein [Steroidobacteraceae bacterium]